LKKATAIAERRLVQHKPSQYFAVIIDNEEDGQASGIVHIQEVVARLLNIPSRNVTAKVFRDRATGVEGGKRRYGEIVGIITKTMNGKVHQTTINNLVSIQARLIAEKPTISRVFYAIKDLAETKPYAIGVRSVQTKDFLKAQVSDIPWTILNNIADEITEACSKVSTVYYDVTPKPPATIEME
jgi:GMP synthase (glutamine-hydrolysing)